MRHSIKSLLVRIKTTFLCETAKIKILFKKKPTVPTENNATKIQIKDHLDMYKLFPLSRK
jgi:hypothetical protein